MPEKGVHESPWPHDALSPETKDALGRKKRRKKKMWFFPSFEAASREFEELG
jgi:hypothetical protein